MFALVATSMTLRSSKTLYGELSINSSIGKGAFDANAETMEAGSDPIVTLFGLMIRSESECKWRHLTSSRLSPSFVLTTNRTSVFPSALTSQGSRHAVLLGDVDGVVTNGLDNVRTSLGAFQQSELSPMRDQHGHGAPLMDSQVGHVRTMLA